MTTVFVAANGGHLSQLVELEKRMITLGPDRLWVTFDSPQSRSLLQGKRVEFIAPIEERDVAGTLRGAFAAHQIIDAKKVTAVVSTGSGIALSFLPYASLRGIPAHYIESAARVDSPSLTGRLLQWTPGVRLYCQYPHAAKGRWHFGGSVFDGFEAADEQRSEIRRIVVTLGSGVHAFRRLVVRMVAILPKRAVVLWQTGSTPVHDLPIEAKSIVPAAELDQAIREADVVISHAGCGSALSAMKANRFPVLVPRDRKHRELVDSHQIEIAQWLSARDLALHRSPDSLTLDDILLAAKRRIVRRTQLPAFRFA